MLIIAARIKADAVLVAHCFGTTAARPDLLGEQARDIEWRLARCPTERIGDPPSAADTIPEAQTPRGVVSPSQPMPAAHWRRATPLAAHRLSTEISLKTVFIRDARGRMDLALASIPFKLPAPRPDDRLVEPAQSGSSIGAMGGTRKGSSGPASHRNAPGQSTPGAYPCTGTCKRSSTLDPPHDRPEHRSCTDARTRS